MPSLMDKKRIMNHEADSLSESMWNKYMQPNYFYSNYSSESYYRQRTYCFVAWFIELGAPLTNNIHVNQNFPLSRIMQYVIQNRNNFVGKKIFKTSPNNSYAYNQSNCSGYYSNMSSQITTSSPNINTFKQYAAQMTANNPYFNNIQGEYYNYNLSSTFDSYVLRQTNYNYHAKTEMFIHWYFELGACFHNYVPNNYLYNHLFEQLEKYSNDAMYTYLPVNVADTVIERVKQYLDSIPAPAPMNVRFPLTPDSSLTLTGPQKEAVFDERIKRAIYRLQPDKIVIKADENGPTIESLSNDVQSLIQMNKKLQREIRSLKDENEQFKQMFESIGAVCVPPKN